MLFRIHNGRKVWIDIIRNHQQLEEKNRLYICDLHFKPDDVQKHRKKTVLRKEAVPSLKYVLVFTNWHENVFRPLFRRNSVNHLFSKLIVSKFQTKAIIRK